MENAHQPKLPIYFYIAVTLFIVTFLLITLPFAAWAMLGLIVDKRVGIVNDDNLLLAIMMFSGFTLMFPVAALGTLADNPEAFFLGKPRKAFIPLTVGWGTWTWFLLADMIDSLVYDSARINVKNPPEVVLVRTESLSAYGWILHVSIAISALCILIVGYNIYRHHYRNTAMSPAKR